MKIKLKDFERLFSFKASKKLKQIYNNLDLNYKKANKKEVKQIIKNINTTLNNQDVKTSGPHRINDWDNGWDENCIEINKTKSFDSLKPKYFNKLPFTRINNQFVKSKNPNFEYDCFVFLQSCLYEAFCKNFDSYYEFGCGTGHNLVRCESLCDIKNIYGFDWAKSSQRCIQSINNIFNKNFNYKNFDFENPDYSIDFSNNSVICTLAALEQIGDRHEKFLNFLLEKKPSLCVHLEPIEEVLSTTDELENLSIKYFNKRKYLSKFLTTLKKLENNNKIEIIKVNKTGIGSYFIEGYTLIVWRVK